MTELEMSMLNLLTSNTGDLIIVTCNKEEVRIHRAIAANCSEYFTLNDRVRSTKSSFTTRLNKEELMFVLRYIYTRRLEDVPAWELDRLFLLLDDIRMRLLTKLETHVQCMIVGRISAKNVIQMLILADKYHFDEIRTAALSKFGSIFPVHAFCYDKNSTEKYRYCCKHDYKSQICSSNFCYYYTAFNNPIQGCQTYCCLHSGKQNTGRLPMENAEAINDLTREQLIELVSQLLDE